MTLALQLCQAQKKVWREVRYSACSPSFHSQPQKFFLKIINIFISLCFSWLEKRESWRPDLEPRSEKHCWVNPALCVFIRDLLTSWSGCALHPHRAFAPSPADWGAVQCSFWQIAWLFCYKEFHFPRMNYEDFFLFVVLGLSYLKMCSLSYHALPSF